MRNRLENPNFEREFENQRLTRLESLRNIDLDKKLRELFRKSTIRFRSSQREILGDILDRVRPILAILPTGSGKSVLFQLPSFLGSFGVSILIEPLVSLLQDQFSRAPTLGISSAIFNARSPPDSACLVFTTPETFLSLDFRNFINRLRITYRLDRVFIDEVQVVLNLKESFRKRLSRLGEIVNFKTQLVLLTATLPPKYELDLLRTLGLDSTRPKIYRNSTLRENIRYSVYSKVLKEKALFLIREKDSYLYSNNRAR